MKNIKNSGKNGFSLLELLVVIGIVSILLATQISNYTTIQKRARDSRRAADLKQIQQAAEQYYAVCGFEYPTNILTEGLVCASPVTTILAPEDVPTDPLGDAYECTLCGGSSYEICANLEVAVGTTCIKNQQ